MVVRLDTWFTGGASYRALHAWCEMTLVLVEQVAVRQVMGGGEGWTVVVALHEVLRFVVVVEVNGGSVVWCGVRRVVLMLVLGAGADVVGHLELTRQDEDFVASAMHRTGR